MQTTRGTTLTPGRGLDRRLIWALLAVGLTAIDQVTKILALSRLDPMDPIPLLGGLLTLQLTWNDGAAFSLGGGGELTWVFTTFSSVMFVAVTTYVLTRLRHRGWAVVLGVLTAGICGNLIDRLFRPPGFGVGHVVDFLQLPNWPIFNVADMCVCFAAAGLIWLAVIKNVAPGEPVAEAAADESTVDESTADESTVDESTVDESTSEAGAAADGRRERDPAGD